MRDLLVVGLGAVDRGDDGIGPVVVGLVQEALAARRGAELGPSGVGPVADLADPCVLVPGPMDAGGAVFGSAVSGGAESGSEVSGGAGLRGAVSGGAVSGGAVSGGTASVRVVPMRTDPEAVPEVVVHTDPTALVELMAGRSLAVVVDALRSPGQAGSVHVLEAGQTPLPAATDPGPAGSHGFGLASSLELARALGSLPPRVVVVGVVGSRFTVGAPLSDPVAAAVPAAAAAVLCALGLPPAGPGGTSDAGRPSRWETSPTRPREVGHVH